MTNHEAIQFLNNMIGEEHGRSIGADGFYRELCAYHVDALTMAIKALEQERSMSAEITQYRYDCEKLMEENERLKKALEQEPKWDRLYSWLNDMRLGIAPDETTPDDEWNERLAQVDVIDDIMEWMVEETCLRT